jgi:hypothetical protein
VRGPVAAIKTADVGSAANVDSPIYAKHKQEPFSPVMHPFDASLSTTPPETGDQYSTGVRQIFEYSSHERQESMLSYPGPYVTHRYSEHKMEYLKQEDEL